MPVTFDNATATAQTSTVSFTVALTVATNAVLLAFACGKDIANSVSSMAYNGVALTRLGQTGARAGGGSVAVEAWGLTAPAAGANNLVVKFVGAAQLWAVGAVSYLNAKAVGPFGTVQSATINTSSVITLSVSSTSTGVVAGGWACIDDISATNFTTRKFDNNSYGFRIADSAGAATISLSAVTGADVASSWAVIGVPIVFSAAAAGGPATLMCMIGVSS